MLLGYYKVLHAATIFIVRLHVLYQFDIHMTHVYFVWDVTKSKSRHQVESGPWSLCSSLGTSILCQMPMPWYRATYLLQTNEPGDR